MRPAEQDAEDNARVIGRKAKIEAMKDAYEKRQLEEAKLAADLKKRMQQSAGSKAFGAFREGKKTRTRSAGRIEKKRQLMAKKMVEESGIKLSEQQLQNMTGEELLKRRQEMAIKEHKKAASK